MAGGSVGTAYLTLVPKLQSGWKRRTESELGGVDSRKPGEQAGKQFGDGVVSMAKRAGVALAGLELGSKAFDLGKAAIDAYAQTEQLTGGIDKLFGNSGKTIGQYAKDAGKSVRQVTSEYERQGKAAELVKANAAKAYQTAGMSANDYMQTTIGISAALKNSLGGDSEKAAKQADKAVRQMSDNFNTYGAVPIENIRMAYAGFARENYTMLDNLSLGYAGSKAGMESLIKDANEYARSQGKNSKLTIDSYSDIIDAIELIQEKQGVAGTTSREAASTIEGSVNSMGSAWSNWLAGLADEDADMGDLTSRLLDSVATAAGNVLPKVGEVLGNVGSLVSEALLDGSDDVGPALADFFANTDWEAVGTTVTTVLTGTFQTVFQSLGQAIMSLGSVILPAVGEALSGVGDAVLGALGELGSEASAALGLAMQALPGALSGVAGAVGGALAGVGGAISGALSGAAGVAAGVASGVVSGFLSGLSGMASGIAGAIGGVAGTVGSALSGVPSAVSGALSSAASVASGVVGSIRSVFSSGFNAALSVVRGIFNNVKNAITNPLNTARGMVSSAINAIKGIINGAHLSLPHFKLPHFNVSGGKVPWGLGGQGTAPKISVDWYAKGGVFDSAQIIGIGEKGREAALPLNDRVYGEIARGIERNGGERTRQQVVTVNLNYQAGADANQMVRDIALGLRRLQMTGA